MLAVQATDFELLKSPKDEVLEEVMGLIVDGAKQSVRVVSVDLRDVKLRSFDGHGCLFVFF